MSNVGIAEEVLYRVRLRVLDGNTWTLRDTNSEKLEDIKRRVIGKYPIETDTMLFAAGAVTVVTWTKLDT